MDLIPLLNKIQWSIQSLSKYKKEKKSKLGLPMGREMQYSRCYSANLTKPEVQT